MHVFGWIDNQLNKITMYRLVTYGLLMMAFLGIGFSYGGVLSLSGNSLLLSAGVYLVVCYAVNRLFTWAWQVPVNQESWLITALILFFIMQPVTSVPRLLGAVGVAIMAIASKYLFVYRRKHIFNPAAFAAVVASLLGLLYAGWWVGNSALLFFMIPFGMLVVRKIRRIGMVLAYMAAVVATYLVVQLQGSAHLASAFWQLVASSPFLFLGAIMLTEPATAPSTKDWHYAYAILVGGLSVAQIHFGDRLFTAEMALLAGNVMAFAVSPKYKLELTLKEARQLSEKVYDFVFESDRRPAFTPGQYMDFTLPHAKPDGRGNRRTFTIASSPTENELHIGVKFYEPSSSYKQALKALQPGQKLVAGQQAGNFILPAKPTEKLVWIAGGIGITPFRSQAKYLLDTNQQRDIVLFYMISDPKEISYLDVLTQASAIGLKTMPVLFAPEMPANWPYAKGLLTAELLQHYAPDFKDRSFYISGPPRMVDSARTILRQQQVSASKIITDHFSGY